MPAAQWLSRNSPSAPMETPTAKLEIGEKSLRRELSAGCSEGRVVNEGWGWSWTEPG
jgi:hypothetical protein